MLLYSGIANSHVRRAVRQQWLTYHRRFSVSYLVFFFCMAIKIQEKFIIMHETHHHKKGTSMKWLPWLHSDSISFIDILQIVMQRPNEFTLRDVLHYVSLHNPSSHNIITDTAVTLHTVSCDIPVAHNCNRFCYRSSNTFNLF